MCGIAGFFEPVHTHDADEFQSILLGMTDRIRHRGPDDSGYWADIASGIALGHRRLSILDLSAAGNQPMPSADGRYVTVYNGEVYNFVELRDRLETERKAPIWRGHSDTEVILAAIAAWGIEKALKRMNGMFALALWDLKERRLTLARDRAGEKPLYYGWQGGTLLFASELKAMAAHPAWHAVVDRSALASYTRFGYVPAPKSMFQGIQKLCPGSFISFSADASPHVQSVQQQYWSAVQTARSGLENSLILSDGEATDTLEKTLSRAVRLRMVADVPLGAFLSGGIDSSTIVALMQAQSSRPVKTFTIGFREADFNEAVIAKSISHHLGTDHTEFYVTARQAMDVVPRLPDLYDEPFGDSSQIPTFLVSQMARHHVTVALSGDAGDELFGGYNRYFQLKAIWKRIANWHPSGLNMAASALRNISPAIWDTANRALPAHIRQPALGDKMQKLADVLSVKDPNHIYQNLVSLWKNTSRIVLDSHESGALPAERMRDLQIDDLIDRMMLVDFITYLPDDILTKVDRASMGVSLEARIPLLDPSVIELAWQLPQSQKIRDGQGKWLLRQVLYRHVPKNLVERPKMGFSVPIADWLRGPLRDWAEALLDQRRLKEEGWFNCQEVQRMWHTHQSGRRNFQHYLWAILMFQAWLDQQDGVAIASRKAISA